MNAPVVEAQARARYEIAHRARHHCFARFGFRCDACRNVHGDTGDIAPIHLNFAGVQATAHGDAQRSQRFRNGEKNLRSCGFFIRRVLRIRRSQAQRAILSRPNRKSQFEILK